MLINKLLNLIKKNKEKKINRKFVCQAPFQSLVIENVGCFVCCSNWCSLYKVGDIFKQSYKEIWNSKEIQNLRKMMIDGKAQTICKADICPYFLTRDFGEFNVNPNVENNIVMKTSPQIVKFGYDAECNINCNFCRDKIIRNTEEQNKQYDALISKKFLPALKDAKIVIINASGDPFASRHSQKLIGEISKKYKYIKFDILTNGTLCSEMMLKKLNLLDNIYKIRISLNAASEETYNKVCPGNGQLFNTILENIKFLSKLKDEKNFELHIQMVITSDNYKDIPKFIKFVHQYNSIASLWEFFPDCCTYENAPIGRLNIFDRSHENHKDLLTVLQDPILKLSNVNLSPLIKSLIK